MNRREFIETSGVATGAAVLGGVTPLTNQPGPKDSDQKTLPLQLQAYLMVMALKSI